MNTTTNNLTSMGDDAIMTSNNTAPPLAPSSYGMYYNNYTTYNESDTMYAGDRSSNLNDIPHSTSTIHRRRDKRKTN